MKKKYLYNGQIIGDADVMDAAKQSNLDIDSYIKKSGIKAIDDNYSLDGKDFSAEDILEAANQSKLGFDDYIQKAGFQKKNPNGNGGSPSSAPSTSQSEPVPDFGMKSFADLAKGQQVPADNTTSTSVKDFEGSVDEQAHRQERATAREEQKQKVLAAVPAALDNTVKNSLKIKGINAQPGSAQYEEEKKKYALQLATGDATVAFDKAGNPGLNRTTGFFDNIASHANSARIANQQADDFANKMTDEQRVDYLKNQQAKAGETAYIGEKQSSAGSVGAMLGDQVPFVGKAVLGGVVGTGLAMAAPETMGASAAVLPKVMSFIFTAHDAASQGVMSKVVSDFHILKQQHPEMSDVEAMAKAREGEWLGRATGIATNALLMETGGKTLADKPIINSIVPKALEDILKHTVVKGSAKIAGVQVAEDIAGNLTGGAERSASDIAKDGAESFKDNVSMLGLLHLATGVANKVFTIPKYLHSAIKSELVKQDPQAVEGALKINEEAGNVPEGTTDRVMADLHDFKDAENKTAPGLSDESRASVAGLIQKRTGIEKEAATKDVTAQPVYEEQVKSINSQIEKIQQTNDPLKYEVDEATGETYKNEVPVTETQAGVTDEGTDKVVEQPAEIKAVSKDLKGEDKETWMMNDTEFDKHWEKESKQGVSKEVDKKVSSIDAEIKRQEDGIASDPTNPANSYINKSIENLKADKEAQLARLTATDSEKPSEFMDNAQKRWHKGIDEALKEDKYNKAISDGRMTANDAKTIIESAGIEVPKDILELAKSKPETPEVKQHTEAEVTDMMKPLRGKVKSQIVKINEIDAEGNTSVREMKARDAHAETVKQIKLLDLITDCLTK